MCILAYPIYRICLKANNSIFFLYEPTNGYNLNMSLCHLGNAWRSASSTRERPKRESSKISRTILIKFVTVWVHTRDCRLNILKFIHKAIAIKTRDMRWDSHACGVNVVTNIPIRAYVCIGVEGMIIVLCVWYTPVYTCREDNSRRQLSLLHDNYSIPTYMLGWMGG